MFIRFTNDKNRIRWHVSEQDATTYKLSACGFNNQPTQIMDATVFEEAIKAGLIVLDQVEAA